MTRRSLIRELMQQKNFLKAEELQNFEKFSVALDSAIVHRYHVLLQELKVGIMLFTFYFFTELN